MSGRVSAIASQSAFCYYLIIIIEILFAQKENHIKQGE